MTTRRAPLFYPLVILITAVLLWLVVGPNLQLVLGSFLERSADGLHLTLAGYREFFLGRGPGQPNIELEALRNSLVISVGSVILSALIGVPLAFLFQRYEFPGRKLVAALATVPVLLPPLVGVVAFYFLYAESGLVTRAVRLALHLDHTPWTFKGLGAVLVIHAYSMYVYFYVFVTAGLARLDEAQLEAASTLGASKTRQFFTVALPLLTPALVGASLLVFMMSMASFTAPYVIGGVRVLTTQLLVSRQFDQLILMRTETVVLIASSVLFLSLLQRFESRGQYVGGVKGAAGRRKVIGRGATRFVAAALGLVAVLVLLLPHAMLVLMSFANDAKWTTQLLPPVYTTANYAAMLGDPGGRLPFVNSLGMATWSTLGNFVFAILAAYLLARFVFPGRSALGAAAVLPWAIPGTVIALGLAEWFSVKHPWLGRFVWINTYGILPLAYFVRNLPLTLRATQASLAQLDVGLEEAAATLGAGPGRVLRTVVLPLVLPGAVAGAILAFIGAVGEYVASVVLSTYSNRPVAIEIANQMRASYFGRAAVCGVLLIAMIAVLLGVYQLLSKREASAVVG